MITRLPAIAAAVVALVVCVLAYSLSQRGADTARTTSSGSAAAPQAPKAREPLPAPAGAPVVRIAGVEHGNVAAHTTKLDFATLDRLGVEEITLREPFLKRDVTFTGVRMSELLGHVGGTGEARRLYLHALDDYHVDLPLADVASDGFLAVRQSGKPIEIADGGPVRLLFTSDDGLGANTDNWIWSIDSIRVIP